MQLFNECEKDILSIIQQQYHRRLYNVNDVYGIMDIGNLRKYQEDSMLISSRVDDSSCELLLVADGMGGLNNGALASNIAAFETLNWFQNIDKKDLYHTLSIKKKFELFADSLDQDIREKCGGGGTTMVVAFILHDTVLIANIGDSRAYVFNNNELHQITTDHSITQMYVDEGKITRENMRFHKQNNLIISRLGCEKKLLQIDFTELGFDSIDYLFLFSDGVTDCISDKRLEEIIKNRYPNVCKKIMKEVLTVDSYSNGLDQLIYNEIIPAGKDNASILCKRRKHD